MASEEERIEKARKTVQAKLGFVRHFIVYILVLLVLAVLNNVTYSGYQWWFWVAFCWGIGVVFHFLSIFLFRRGALEEWLLNRELERMDGKK